MGDGINPPAANERVVALGVIHGHNNGLSQQAAEIGMISRVFPGYRNDACGGVFLLIIPMAISSAMMADRVSAVVLPGMATISRPTEQTLVMASSFSRLRKPSAAD